MAHATAVPQAELERSASNLADASGTSDSPLSAIFKEPEFSDRGTKSILGCAEDS